MNILALGGGQQGRVIASGVASGISHLACGHIAAQGPVEEPVMYVGGVAQDAPAAAR